MISQLSWSKISTGLVILAVAGSLTGVFAADKKTSKKNSSRASHEANLGKALLEKNECMVCHSIKGTGGCLAPPFDGIGSIRSKDFLMARITAGKREEDRFFEIYEAQELMPHVRLPRRITEPMVDYLLTIPALKSEETVASVKHEIKTEKHKELSAKIKPHLKSTPDDKEIALGKRLVAEKGCQACHSIQKTGGTFGPALDHIGSKRTIDFIADQIIAAEIRPIYEGNQPMDTMPPQGLSLDEIQAIAKFLKTLK